MPLMTGHAFVLSLVISGRSPHLRGADAADDVLRAAIDLMQQVSRRQRRISRRLCRLQLLGHHRALPRADHFRQRFNHPLRMLTYLICIRGLQREVAHPNCEAAQAAPEDPALIAVLGGKIQIACKDRSIPDQSIYKYSGRKVQYLSGGMVQSEHIHPYNSMGSHACCSKA